MRSFLPRSVGPRLAVATLVAAGAAAALGYGLTAPKHYRATAQLLVSPVSVDDPTFTGLDVLRDSGGRRTAVASATALLHSPQVADVVRADLGLARSRDSLLGALDAHVVGASDVVAVTVDDTSAAGAAQLANAFADALVKQRTASFQSQLAATIRRDQQLLASQRGTAAGTQLAKRLAVLQGFQGEPDPTIRHAGQASAPTSASWPKLPELAAIGAGSGLAAGALVALVLAPLRRRRRVSEEAGASDRVVSDRLVDRLEGRVSERIAALEAERARLSARETALDTREREISAKLGELGSAAEAAAAAPADLPFDARTASLDARVAEITQRELGLARGAAQIAAREREVTAREQELASRAAELDARHAAASSADDARRRADAARRVAEESRLAAEADEERRTAEAREAVEARLAAEAAATPTPPPVPEPTPPPAPAAASPRTVDGADNWNLMVLERLVSERGAEFPARHDEWLSYLFFLREYTEADGTVPARFDWLIRDTFAELIE